MASAHADPTPDPAVARRDGLIALSLVVLVAATVLIGALPSGAPGGRSGTPSGAPAPSEDASCAEWSDGCRVCLRRAGGTACSLPGIACTRGEVRCLRRVAG